MSSTSSLLVLGGGSLKPILMPIAVACAVAAAAILLWYLIVRPKLSPAVKIVLFFGLGVFPAGLSMTGNIVDFEHTATREFCSGCHVMHPWTDDVADPDSKTLAAMHSRNPNFGGNSCYACHSNYGMFGTVATKIGGMKHTWMYYTEYRNYSIEEAVPKIHIYKPFPNSTCMQCHSTTLPGYMDIPDHASALDRVRDGSLSCASAGCHGPAHPFSKPEETETAEANAP